VKIFVQRNGQQFGPYPVPAAQQYLSQGTLLPQDLARMEGSAAPWIALSQLLAQAGLPSPAGSGANPFKQALHDLKAIDLRLIFPWRAITSKSNLQDRRLVTLSAIGLAPLFALALGPVVSLAYWAIALYFSALWALFFYYLFRTPQVVPRLCFLCFFFTGLVSITALLALQEVPPWSLLYGLAKSGNFLARAVGMLAGVGFHEELCKAAILFWLVRRPGNLLIPQTVVFYGMISGLGFGIHEGVVYQRTVNREQAVDVAYFLDIARLTSLPFLHAIWTGIAGYFISFAALFPGKKYALWMIGILIPATLHGVYDIFGLSFVGLATALCSVTLLITYLANCQRMQQHLSTP